MQARLHELLRQGRGARAQEVPGPERLGFVCEKEPFRKLINQGMIQGRSNFVYRIKGTSKFVSTGLKDEYDTTEIHVDVNIVNNALS